MMWLMASVCDQTTQIYDAMSKHLPSIRSEDAWYLCQNRKSGSLDPNRIANNDDEPRRTEVRQLTEEGLEFYNAGRLEEAADCYKKALELCAESNVALYNLGVISGELKRYEESKAAFQHLVRSLKELGDVVDPTTLASAHQGVGAALLGLWSVTVAEEPPLAAEGELEFRRAIALDPNCFGAWVGLGVALHILERLDDAESAFRKALEIEPDSQVAVDRLRSVLEDKLEKRLFELGYLSRINKTIRDFTPYENRTPIRVEGKPLSEIIVEERR